MSKRLDLHKKIGAALGPIIERETNATDVLDVMMVHTCEIMITYYGLKHSDAIHCYSQMHALVQTFISQGEKDDNF